MARAASLGVRASADGMPRAARGGSSSGPLARSSFLKRWPSGSDKGSIPSLFAAFSTRDRHSACSQRGRSGTCWPRTGSLTWATQRRSRRCQRRRRLRLAASRAHCASADRWPGAALGGISTGPVARSSLLKMPEWQGSGLPESSTFDRRASTRALSVSTFALHPGASTEFLRADLHQSTRFRPYHRSRSGVPRRTHRCSSPRYGRGRASRHTRGMPIG